MPRIARLALLPALLMLGACATYPPAGPSAMVLPGTGKSFDQFRADDMECRQYASAQTGAAAQAATDSAVTSAVVGTAIGALAGAAMGGNSNAAGAGAGVGLLTGSMMGASAGSVSAYEMQRRYDIGYNQCMYSKGHRIPVSGRFDSHPSSYTSQPASPPAAAMPPPPPPGAPPPPPPR